MRLFYFSCATLGATWILLLIGGLVNPMGASLACPDWYFVPTCNGELFPKMAGGVLYEHGHRLWASFVGLMTLLLAIVTWASKKTDRLTRWLTVAAVFMVALQGTLGGITVLLGLSAVVSTMHLGIAMIFFCLLILIAFRLYPRPIANRGAYQSGFIALTASIAFLQILVGGTIRHVGAGLACGDDWLGCGPSFWPSWHLGQVHMTHRLIGYVLCAMILWASHRAFYQAKRFGDRSLQILAILPVLLVVVQIALGLFTVATVRSIPIVVMHTGFGALLLASLYVLYLRCRHV